MSRPSDFFVSEILSKRASLELPSDTVAACVLPSAPRPTPKNSENDPQYKHQTPIEQNPTDMLVVAQRSNGTRNTYNPGHLKRGIQHGMFNCGPAPPDAVARYAKFLAKETTRLENCSKVNWLCSEENRESGKKQIQKQQHDAYVLEKQQKDANLTGNQTNQTTTPLTEAEAAGSATPSPTVPTLPKHDFSPHISTMMSSIKQHFGLDQPSIAAARENYSLKALNVGSGMGLTARELEKLGDKIFDIESVELNPGMVEVSEHQFGFKRSDHMRVTVQDAIERVHELARSARIARADPSRRFDLIIDDMTSTALSGSSKSSGEAGGESVAEVVDDGENNDTTSTDTTSDTSGSVNNPKNVEERMKLLRTYYKNLKQIINEKDGIVMFNEFSRNPRIFVEKDDMEEWSRADGGERGVDNSSENEKIAREIFAGWNFDRIAVGNRANNILVVRAPGSVVGDGNQGVVSAAAMGAESAVNPLGRGGKKMKSEDFL